MVAIAVRVRSPSGVVTVSFERDGTDLAAFAALVEQASGCRGLLRVGFPPELLTDVASLRAGDTVTVAPPPAEPQPPPPEPSPPLTSAAPEAAALLPPASISNPPPACVPLPGGAGALVLRDIAADNSCLFSAVSLCVAGSTEGSGRLRQVVSEAVLNDAEGARWSLNSFRVVHVSRRPVAPGVYDEAFLGKPPAAYAEWVLQPESWGGAIELDILSKHCGVRIDAADGERLARCRLGFAACDSLSRRRLLVQSAGRVYSFGEAASHDSRILLVYDGLHYDCVTSTPQAGAPADFDVRQFAIDDAAVTEAFASLVLARRAHPSPACHLPLSDIRLVPRRRRSVHRHPQLHAALHCLPCGRGGRGGRSRARPVHRPRQLWRVQSRVVTSSWRAAEGTRLLRACLTL